ncbi:atherin-like [Sagmatias obliquidens]|uniref:atherin-like n=1 Tax=Sagmatias obliquidens TaxID=3371155 RepID=UPI000F446606|nr:atherin-like [Lagenorhynchus obliquidens]
MARARVRPGRQGPGHWGAALTRLPGCCRRPATASLGSAFVFPTAITFAEVLLAPGAPGVQAVAALSAPKDDNRLGIQGEGDSSRGAQGGATPPPRRARPLPPRAGLRLTCGGRRRRRELSCAGRGEPSPPGTGRRLRAPGRRLSRRRSPSRAGHWFLGSCGGAGRGGGMRAGGGTGSCEPSVPVGATFSPPPPLPLARPPPLATGWTRFRAERRGPAARCSAPPPAAAAAAADASAAAPPGLPPALAAPGDPPPQPCRGGAPRRGRADARVYPQVPAPRLPAKSPPPRPQAKDAGLAPGGGGGE